MVQRGWGCKGEKRVRRGGDRMEEGWVGVVKEKPYHHLLNKEGQRNTLYLP